MLRTVFVTRSTSLRSIRRLENQSPEGETRLPKNYDCGFLSARVGKNPTATVDYGTYIQDTPPNPSSGTYR
jgi:hypothetical protein